MFYTNPFAELINFMPVEALQAFVILMVAMVALGTILDMAHKKNAKYFFITVSYTHLTLPTKA